MLTQVASNRNANEYERLEPLGNFKEEILEAYTTTSVLFIALFNPASKSSVDLSHV